MKSSDTKKGTGDILGSDSIQWKVDTGVKR